MGSKHEVEQGECLSVIAERHGFHDYSVLYDHPDNKKLKQARPNPNVLEPGDKVALPKLEERSENAPVDKLTSFKLIQPKKELRVVLSDRHGEPLADEPYDFQVEGRPPLKDQRTDGDGLIKQPVPLGARRATLEVRGRTLKLELGALNPAWNTPDEGVRGAQARLHNLGFNVGPEDGELGRRTHAAIAMFQHEQGMTIDGELTEELANALRDAHGS
jgi:hypothetical protein